jgi:GAF domain-containing protein
LLSKDELKLWGKARTAPGGLRQRLFESGMCASLLLGPHRKILHLAVAYGLSEAYLHKGPVQLVSSPIDQRVLSETQLVVLTELTQAAGFQYPQAAEQEGIRSLLVLPLQVRGTSVGVMWLYSGQVRQFGAEEINFAMAVVNLDAIAIENTTLHEALKERLKALKTDADGWYRFLTLS